MNKLDALKAIAEGINYFIEIEVENASPVSEEPKQEEKPKKSKVASIAEKRAKKEVEEEEEVAEEVDVDSMDYRQLKAYASEIGMKAKGTKGQLLKAVKDFLANGDEEVAEEEEEEEEKPAKKPVRGVASIKAKKAEEEVESEEDEEPEDDDSEDENTTIKEVESTIKEQELTDDDLRDILKDLGLSTKGGHEVLVSKLADAVDAGELSLDDDEVEEEADEEETESEEEDVADDEVAAAEESDEEAEITAERKQAIDDFTAETTEAFENEELSIEDMRDFIKDFGEKISKKASGEEVLVKYLECASKLIDDEGNTVEEGAYMHNGVPFCCGHALEISEDGTSGKCNICGEEYEFEE
jgi:hypothetical protein